MKETKDSRESDSPEYTQRKPYPSKYKAGQPKEQLSREQNKH